MVSGDARCPGPGPGRESKTVMDEEMERLLRDGPTADELALAQGTQIPGWIHPR